MTFIQFVYDMEGSHMTFIQFVYDMEGIHMTSSAVTHVGGQRTAFCYSTNGSCSCVLIKK